ncbi:MAG TPA: Ig-like domain-containing protein [Longimicrobiales bacterium]|nr:Ig-like domain-containing protein [Longimicrobiales bacterium]
MDATNGRALLRGVGRVERMLIIATAVLGLGACSDDDPTGPGETPKPVAVVVVQPGELTLSKADTATLGVELFDADGRVLTGRHVTWSSSAPQFVTVNGNGRLTAVAAGGPVLITATSEGMTGPALVSVTDDNPTPVAEVLDPASVAAGSGPVNITVLGQGFVPESVVRFNGQARPTTYVAAGVLEVDLTAADVTAAGQGQIDVANPGPGGGTSGALQLTIVAPAAASVVLDPLPGEVAAGDAVPLSARALDGQGQEIPGRPITWTSSDETVATVTPGGVLGAHRAGKTRIRATIDGLWAEIEVTVKPGTEPVAYVFLDPGAHVMLLGSEITFGTRIYTTGGTVVTDRPISWRVDNPAIAVVDPQGRVRGVGKGVTHVRATVEGREGTARIEVRAYPAGPLHTYDMHLDLMTILPAVGVTTWTDTSGNERLAELILTGASLDIDHDLDTYLLTWKLGIFVGEVGVVGHTTRTESGSAERYYRVPDDYGYLLTPNGGTTLEVPVTGPGELVMRRALGGIPTYPFRFVIR